MEEIKSPRLKINFFSAPYSFHYYYVYGRTPIYLNFSFFLSYFFLFHNGNVTFYTDKYVKFGIKDPIFFTFSFYFFMWVKKLGSLTAMKLRDKVKRNVTT